MVCVDTLLRIAMFLMCFRTVIKCINQAIIDSENECKRCIKYGDLEDTKQYLSNHRINCVDKRKNTLPFTYIPQHLHHMVFEILKNSMRAIIENTENEDKGIDIVVIDGEDGSVTIKISDIGGGIPRAELQKIWLYGYTTGHKDVMKHKDVLADIIAFAEKQNQLDYHKYVNSDLSLMFDASVMGAVKYTPMFGLGYGLPITKLYANYFGGDCKIQSLHGHGTDAYLYLNNLSNCKSILI